MADEAETIDLPPDLSGADIGRRMHDRYDEIVTSQVAELLAEGFEIDQISVEQPVITIDLERRTMRVTTRVVGRRIEIDD